MISIPANIAEGFKKRGGRGKIRFLDFALGSLDGCRCYLLLIVDLGYSSTAEMVALLEEVCGLLGAYARTIESNR